MEQILYICGKKLYEKVIFWYFLRKAERLTDVVATESLIL